MAELEFRQRTELTFKVPCVQSLKLKNSRCNGVRGREAIYEWFEFVISLTAALSERDTLSRSPGGKRYSGS